MASSFEDAFKKAEEAKERKEEKFGEAVGAEVHRLLSDPEFPKDIETSKKIGEPQRQEEVDLHALKSITSVSEQKYDRKERERLVKKGLLPKEKLTDIGGVDARDIHAPQYNGGSREMREDMDKLKDPPPPFELPKQTPSALRDVEELPLEDITRDRAKLAMERGGGVDFDIAKLEAEEQRQIDLNIEAARTAELSNPWGKYRESRDAVQEEFEKMYPNKEEILPDVLANYQSLRDRQLESFKPGAEDEQEKIAAEIESFMARERLAADAREGSKILPTMFRSPPEQPMKKSPEMEKQVEVEIAVSIEGTPKEWRDKLRGLIGKFTGETKEKELADKKTKEKPGGTAEGLKAYLAKRVEELNSEAAAKKAENFIRTLGESYDKLGFKSKLAVGVGLGLSAAVFTGVSAPLSLLSLAGLTTQRVAGMASMYIKVEKSLQGIAEKDPNRQKWYHDILLGSSERQLKTRALFMAATYTLGVGALTGEAVKLASESSAGEMVHEWLKQHYPFAKTEVPVQAHATGEVLPVAVPHSAAAGETLASAVPPEVASVSVEATKGHGYEYMMKRLWEQMQEKHIALPANADPDSDIYKLVHADAKSIDSVVHRIAADPKHGFFNVDGTSVRIDMGSHMTIGTDGQIHLNGAVQAAEGAPQTPPYHSQMQEVPEPPTTILEGQTEDISANPTEKPAPARPVYLDAQPNTESTPEGAAPVAEASGAQGTVTNQFGLEVASDKPHVYAGAGQVFVYGGSPVEQAHSIQTYLSRHPEGVVFGADETGEHRVPWHLAEGKVVSGPPMRTDGFLGLFSTFIEPPGPKEFEKIIG